jgi:hypothetical protein
MDLKLGAQQEQAAQGKHKTQRPSVLEMARLPVCLCATEGMRQKWTGADHQLRQVDQLEVGPTKKMQSQAGGCHYGLWLPAGPRRVDPIFLSGPRRGGLEHREIIWALSGQDRKATKGTLWEFSMGGAR